MTLLGWCHDPRVWPNTNTLAWELMLLHQWPTLTILSCIWWFPSSWSGPHLPWALAPVIMLFDTLIIPLITRWLVPPISALKYVRTSIWIMGIYVVRSSTFIHRSLLVSLTPTFAIKSTILLSELWTRVNFVCSNDINKNGISSYIYYCLQPPTSICPPSVIVSTVFTINQDSRISSMWI